VLDRAWYGESISTNARQLYGLAYGPCQKGKDLQDSTRFARIKRHTKGLDSADEVNPRRFNLVGQLQDSIAAAGLRLDDDLLDALDKLVEPDEDLYRELPVATQPPACLATSCRRRTIRGVTQ
jgi:hypothetical protein